MLVMVVEVVVVVVIVVVLVQGGMPEVDPVEAENDLEEDERAWAVSTARCKSRAHAASAEAALAEANIQDHTNARVWGYLCLVALLSDRAPEAEQAIGSAFRCGLADDEWPLLGEIGKLFLEHGCYEKSCKHLYPESYGMHLLAQKDTWFTHTQSPNQPTARVATVAVRKKYKDAKRLTELLAAVARHNQAASSVEGVWL